MALGFGLHLICSDINALNTSIESPQFEYHKWGSGENYESPAYYCHGNSGLLVWWRANYASLGGADIYLQKRGSDGAWSNVKTLYSRAELLGDDTSGTESQTYGEGWFRVTGSVSGDVYAKFYPAQKDCALGELLTVYDDFTKSGNRQVGTYLTNELFQAGRGGTFSA